MIRKLTEENKQRIKDLFFEGLTTQFIAERLGIGFTSIYSVTSKLPKCGKCGFFRSWKQKNYGSAGYCPLQKRSKLMRDPGCHLYQEKGV